MAKLPWKPWHEVVALRDDLKTGALSLQMFAADLYEVLMRRGKMPVYEQPENFFALTFPTHNLRQLVRDVALRLANKNDKAVRQKPSARRSCRGPGLLGYASTSWTSRRGWRSAGQRGRCAGFYTHGACWLTNSRETTA